MQVEIYYRAGLERLGGILVGLGSRCVLVIDENTTEEEAQDTIRWV